MRTCSRPDTHHPLSSLRSSHVLEPGQSRQPTNPFVTMQIQSNRRTRRSLMRAGFSLAELMVVIVIIGLLATAVVPKLMDRLGEAKWGKAKSDINGISQALQQYAINNGRYPDSLEALVTPDSNNRTYLDLKALPQDPWGNEYVYEPPLGSGEEPRIICLGADGAPGGEGDDQDRDSIMIKSFEW